MIQLTSHRSEKETEEAVDWKCVVHPTLSIKQPPTSGDASQQLPCQLKHTHTTKISHLGKPPTVCPFHSRLAALMAFFSPQRATAQSSPTREGHTGGEEKTRTAAPLTRREEMNVNVLTWIRRNGNTGLESFIWQRKLITVGSYSCLVE